MKFMYFSKGRSIDEMIEEVDFIIVGEGKAGCILINRLRGRSQNTVLLLEVGNA